MSREEMHKLLESRAGQAPMWSVYLAAITGLCANQKMHASPADIINRALDVCIADLHGPTPSSKEGE